MDILIKSLREAAVTEECVPSRFPVVAFVPRGLNGPSGCTQEAQEKAEREAAKVEVLFARAAAWRKAWDAEALVGEVERRLGEITDAVELADMHAWLARAREAIAQRDPINAGITEVLKDADDCSSGGDEL